MCELKELEINISLEEIKNMTKTKFSRILKVNIKKNAFSYLIGKRGKKGGEISYTSLEMAEYLQPFNASITIEQKRELFAVRNRMIQIPYNFPKTSEKHKCLCSETEDMAHIYNCDLYTNKQQENISYDKIYNGNLQQQLKVFIIFKQNLEQRERMITESKSPCDPVIRYCSFSSNG